MKIWHLSFIFLIATTFAAPIQERRLDPVQVEKLALELGILESADFIEEMQKSWLRKPGQERWEMQELSPKQKEYVLNWAINQKLFSAWKPKLSHYDKAIILGATTCRMQMRLNYLKQLWNKGVRFDEIIWLTGDRPLDARIDTLIERCKNESEAAHIIWQGADIPKEMRDLPTTFLATPMGDKRPNTKDTLITWLKTDPGSCTALFISDQPFCGYQFATINSCLPEEILFDLAGQGVDPTSHPAAAAITLDTIARWLYLSF